MIGSRAKTKAAIDVLLDTHANPAIASLAGAMITLPETDELLDQQLGEWAILLLSLRSDNATPLEIVEHEAATEAS